MPDRPARLTVNKARLPWVFDVLATTRIAKESDMKNDNE